ncbi:MAG: hypothetical protein AABY28_03120 [Candidatus Omnitrophota bacterium]
MKNKFLKKSVFISLLGHLTVLGIFSFSFGVRLPQAQYTNISFWGQLLQGYQFSSNTTVISPAHSVIFFNRKPDTKELDKISKVVIMTQRNYFKPQAALAYNTDKEAFILKPDPPKLFLTGKEPAIIFHPILPYDFTLYFKDRQVAHVELMYKVMPQLEGITAMIKRKISSGNLEVDLLSLRYISRYLFMQHKGIIAVDWRTVKIDLSKKND